tara:strand:+ start:417 stop:1076 length:660 start_codon:yes stop_codon:yes gene_type:complete
MKNHAVNNEYVQNLIEGLLNEECSQPLSIDESKAHIKRQLKSKKISPVEKARLKAKLDAKEHDSEKRKEVAQEAADEEFGESGGHHAKMDLWAGNDQGNIRDQGGAERKPRKVKGAKVQEEGVVKDLVGAVTGPTAQNLYKRGGEALSSAGEVVGDFVSGGVEKAAPGFKKKAGRVWKATKEKVGGLVGKGVNAANEWSKTPDETPEGTKPKLLPKPKK